MLDVGSVGSLALKTWCKVVVIAIAAADVDVANAVLVSGTSES